MSIERLRHWIGPAAPSPHDTELRRLVRDALIEFDAQHAARVADARTFVDAIDAAHEERQRLRAQLAARDAEVPGLSTTPGYTMDDVDRIEAARGKPYVRLRETVGALSRRTSDSMRFAEQMMKLRKHVRQSDDS